MIQTTPSSHGLTFAEVLRIRREWIGWTQQQLGEKCGLNGQWISHYESGRRKPRIENLVALADALCCSTDYLLGRK
jgi:transcriptional regulator with XRE-family HTH domain